MKRLEKEIKAERQRQKICRVFLEAMGLSFLLIGVFMLGWGVFG